MTTEIDSEKWAELPGFDGYKFSSHGRIRSFRRVHPVDLVAQIDKDGYRRLQLMVHGKHKHFVVSRLICEAFNGPPVGEKNTCCHCDNDKSNNRADNLRWDTQKGNIADKRVHGTHQIGEKHPMAEISNELASKVIKFLSARRKWGRLKAASEHFGISYHIVADISRGKTWWHAA